MLEIKQQGIEIKKTTKHSVMEEEAEKIFGGNPFVSSSISQHIFRIADYVTKNNTHMITQNGRPRNVINRGLPKGMEDNYRQIVNGILQTIKPYYGMIGFRDRDALFNDK